MRLQLTVILVLVALLGAATALAADDALAERHFQDGKAFFEKGQFERASYHLDTAYKIAGKWQYLEYIAKTWLALRNYENAFHALDAYLRKGGSAIPAAKKAWAKGELSRIEKEKKFQANKVEADAHFKTARDLYTQRNYEKAAIELEQAYDLNPTWGYLDLIGRTELALKNYDRAVAALEKFLAECGQEATEGQRASVKKLLGEIEGLVAADKKKAEADSHYQEGKKRLESEEFDEAAPALELAYSLYPNWEYLEALGAALAGTRSYRRAAEIYTAYLQQGGGKVAPEKRAALTEEIKRLSGLAAAEVNAQQSKSLEQQGAQLMRERKYGEALGLFQRAYEMNPNIGLFISMAQANEALGRYRDAIALYERYLEAGGSGVSKTTREDVNERLVALKDKIAAEERRARALVFFQSGTGLFAQRSYEQAAIQFNKAYETDPAFQILPSIAETEAVLKNYDLAVQKLEQYLKDGGKELSLDQREYTRKRIAYFQGLGRGETPGKTEAAAAPPVKDELKEKAADDDLEDILSASAEEDSSAPPEKPEKKAKREKKESSYDWDPGKRLWTWILGGVGLASFGGAIGTGVTAHKEQEKVDKVCPGGVCPPEYIKDAQDRQDTVGDLRLSTRVLLVAGIVGVSAGITFFFVEPLFAPESKAEVALVPVLDGESAGLAAVGRF
jgi:tetratricopeptide (TPR) repeat protein